MRTPTRTESAESTDRSADSTTAGDILRLASSAANTTPETGALNAVAKPAPALAATSARLRDSSDFDIFATPSPAHAPIRTLGPSAPAFRPRNTAASDIANDVHMSENGRSLNSPRAGTLRLRYAAASCERHEAESRAYA